MSRGVRLHALLVALREAKKAGQLTDPGEQIVLAVARCCGVAGMEMRYADLATEAVLSEAAVYRYVQQTIDGEFVTRELAEGARSYTWRIHERFAERKTRRAV
jgi:hypothetical protein